MINSFIIIQNRDDFLFLYYFTCYNTLNQISGDFYDFNKSLKHHIIFQNLIL